jgi:hypothetical protein
LTLLSTALLGVPAAHADRGPTPADANRATGCATGATKYGTIRVCPGRAPVGNTVTVSGTGCHNPGSRTVLAVFLGPKAQIGSAGGGVQINIAVHRNHFKTTFDIPATYPEAGDSNTTARTTPGARYHFSVYPAAICDVAFTVTASPPLASTGPTVPLAALVALAIALLLLGVWLTKRTQPRAQP